MKTIETLCVVCSMTSKGGWDGFGMNVEMWQHSEMRWGQDTRIPVTSSGEEQPFRKKRIKKSFGKQLGHSGTPHSGLEINHVCLLYTQYTIHNTQYTTQHTNIQHTAHNIQHTTKHNTLHATLHKNSPPFPQIDIISSLKIIRNGWISLMLENFRLFLVDWMTYLFYVLFDLLVDLL